MIIVHSGDRFFLERYSSLALLGVYALAYKVGMLIEYLTQPFATYWNAQVYRVLKEPSGEQIYVRLCTYMITGLLAAAVGLAVFARPVLDAMVPPAFQPAAVIVPYIAFAYVLRSADQYFRSVLRVEGKTVRDARVMLIGAITALAGYATLIPLLKGMGAALATVLAFGVMTGFGLWEAQRVRRVRFEFRRLAQAFLCATIAILFSVLFAPATAWQNWAAAAGLTAVFPLLLLVTGFFQQGELAAFRRIVRNYAPSGFGMRRPAELE